jgi:hypothetical protein
MSYSGLKYLAGRFRRHEALIVGEAFRPCCATPPHPLTLPRTFPSNQPSAQTLPLTPHQLPLLPLRKSNAAYQSRQYQPCLSATQSARSSSATAISSRRIPTTYTARTRACMSHKSPVYTPRYTRPISGRRILRLFGTQTACLRELGPVRRPMALNGRRTQR